MSGHQIRVAGCGAVSPAGWGMNALRQSLESSAHLDSKEILRPGWENKLQVLQVPPPSPRPAFLAHARFRRTSPISQYGVAASLEALGDDAEKVTRGELRLGIIYCVMAGCVNYSRRFYDEALRDPGTASPLVFPETVFNAPSSHLAAMLGTKAINYTLIGDPGTFLQGLALAGDWLATGKVDGCLVVGGEEIDWIVADGYRRFARKIIMSDGAGAVYLCTAGNDEKAILLNAVTSSHLFLKRQPRHCAAGKMRAEFPVLSAKTVLVDGQLNLSRLDAPEKAAWSGWSGDVVSIKRVLGEGLMAATAWQCVAAIDLLQASTTTYGAANVSVVGCNQQAIGAQFVISNPSL